MIVVTPIVIKGDTISALSAAIYLRVLDTPQAETAVAAAAKARSAALVAAAAAAAAEREAAEAMQDTAGFVAARWQETQQQLWGAAASIMGSVTSTPLAKGEVAPGRSAKDFADDWQAYSEKYERAQVSSDANPNDAMDALEELWSSRIRRSLEATAEEVTSSVTSSVLDKLLTTDYWHTD